jgi:ABC-2 type transport system ATP-binding protein
MENKTMPSQCLTIDSLSKEYKSGKVKANQNISVCFYEGQITAVIGHNGAGKTTLLKQIVGSVRPDSGSITYHGFSLLENMKVTRNIVSMMPQFQVPLEGVTLRQSIESILRVRCVKGAKVKIETDAILSALDIESWAKQSGNKLSGGLQRLTSFAMAVACPAPIILFDEPTNDVDPVRRKRIWQYMRKLAKEGHIVVVVTHNLLEVEQYADRFLLFEHGKIIQDAPARGINSQFTQSTLSVYVNDTILLKDLPLATETKYVEDEGKIVLTLAKEQIYDALAWVLSMTEQSKIISYKLSSASLDESYGEMTNEK